MFRLLTFLVLLASISVDTLCAEDELVLRDPKQAKPEFLVLHNGRVVKGRLIPGPGGYDVVLPAGRLFVPAVQIRFAANSMDDAYQKMKDSVVERTPATHLELARWCLTNQLPTKARREILDALHLDPYSQTASRMLEDLVREQKRASVTVTRNDADGAAQDSDDDMLLTDRRSLGGLPAHLAQTFTRRIQPIVASKCGNAGCHGGNRTSFVVSPIRTRSTAHLAEQNLAAILKQIDLREPLKSPLLRAAEGAHGGSRTLLFSGRSGRTQMQLLRKWVYDTARELNPESALSGHISATPSTPSTTLTESGGDQAATPASLESLRGDEGRSDSEFLTAANIAARHDDFDPGEFNRRFHKASDSLSPNTIQNTKETPRPAGAMRKEPL